VSSSCEPNITVLSERRRMKRRYGFNTYWLYDHCCHAASWSKLARVDREPSASRQTNFVELRRQIRARRHVLDIRRQLALPIRVFPIRSGHVHREGLAQ
jgi:hypothetical protein